MEAVLLELAAGLLVLAAAADELFSSSLSESSSSRRWSLRSRLRSLRALRLYAKSVSALMFNACKLGECLGSDQPQALYVALQQPVKQPGRRICRSMAAHSVQIDLCQ